MPVSQGWECTSKVDFDWLEVRDEFKAMKHFSFAMQDTPRNTDAHHDAYTHKLGACTDVKASTVGKFVRSLFPHIISNCNWFISVSRKCKGFPLSANLKLSYNMLLKGYESGQSIITCHENNEKTIALTFSSGVDLYRKVWILTLNHSSKESKEFSLNSWSAILALSTETKCISKYI